MTALDALQARLAELQAKYDDLLKMSSTPVLPVGISDMLRDLAAQYPQYMEFDERLGMIRMKSDFTFDAGSTEVKPEAKLRPALLAQILDKPEIARNEIQVVGHTDDIPIKAGGPVVAQSGQLGALDEPRLVRAGRAADNGVKQDRGMASGWGDQRPIAPNDPGQHGNVMNRRVDILIRPTTVPEGIVVSTPGAGAAVSRPPAPRPVATRPAATRPAVATRPAATRPAATRPVATRPAAGTGEVPIPDDVRGGGPLMMMLACRAGPPGMPPLLMARRGRGAGGEVLVNCVGVGYDDPASALLQPFWRSRKVSQSGTRTHASHAPRPIRDTPCARICCSWASFPRWQKIASVWPSSVAMSCATIGKVDWNRAKVIVELARAPGPSPSRSSAACSPHSAAGH